MVVANKDSLAVGHRPKNQSGGLILANEGES